MRRQDAADKAAGRPNRLERAAQAVQSRQKHKSGSMEDRAAALTAATTRRTTHDVMKDHGMKPPKTPPKRQDHPQRVHTEIKHKVVATNTRGASVFLKGATAPKN